MIYDDGVNKTEYDFMNEPPWILGDVHLWLLHSDE